MRTTGHDRDEFISERDSLISLLKDRIYIRCIWCNCNIDIMLPVLGEIDNNTMNKY